MKSWQERPFIDYLNAVDDLLEKHYGVTTDDTGVDMAASAQEAGWPPKEAVTAIANKYDLEQLPTAEPERC